MYLRALEGREKALGRDHTSTLQTVNNLGNLYYEQDELKEAEKMYLQALGGKEKVLGPDHRSTLDTVHNLGNVYANQNKLNKVEEMYSRALEGKEKTLGRDHTSTLQTVNNLRNLYDQQDEKDIWNYIDIKAIVKRNMVTESVVQICLSHFHRGFSGGTAGEVR